jgi:hypothetical protein
MAKQSIIPTDSSLHRALTGAARGVRCVVFAGLPGIGKSLLTRQTAQIAREAGRPVTLMQWDTVRTAFEQHPYGRRFPDTMNVAHPVIRIAADDWTRVGVTRWLEAVSSGAFIIIEAPLIGGRMMSLARPAEDAAEALLALETLFVLPVPTRSVKDILRGRRGTDEANDQTLPFATVDVLDELVREINGIAVTIRAADSVAPEYDPESYAAVYLYALRHRRTMRLEIDRVFDIATPTADVEIEEIAPTDKEIVSALDAATRLPDELSTRRLTTWYT